MNVIGITDLLDELNSGKSHDLIFNRPLRDNVEVSLTWFETQSSGQEPSTFFGPTTIYFVKNQTGKYIGLVEDRGEGDLHWFILPHYRGKGYMSTALRTIILPHILLNRDVQNITINHNNIHGSDPLSSSMLAVALGFKLVKTEDGIEYYQLEDTGCYSSEYFNGELAQFNESRAEVLKARVTYFFKKLEIISSELRTKIGHSDELDDIDLELNLQYMRFHDLIYDAYVNGTIKAS